MRASNNDEGQMEKALRQASSLTKASKTGTEIAFTGWLRPRGLGCHFTISLLCLYKGPQQVITLGFSETNPAVITTLLSSHLIKRLKCQTLNF
jgi:hypothetical protein